MSNNQNTTALTPACPPVPSHQEMAVSGMAAQAKAMIEARYLMAINRPRAWDGVRAEILTECKRSSFAENKSTYYVKPIGKGVEGLGIRFVEMALRCMKNVFPEIIMVHEDDTKEVHRICVTDLENNISWSQEIKVSKTVERAKPLEDGSYISVRKNSFGKDTYTVPATDDDILNKRQALFSKAIRVLGLRIIPGDIQEEAEEQIKATRKATVKADPGAEKKKILDAFLKIGVKPQALMAYLGHPVDECSPNELVDLRGIYGAISDGEATWREVMDNKLRQADSDGPKEIDIDAAAPVATETAKPAAEAKTATGKQPITPGF